MKIDVLKIFTMKFCLMFSCASRVACCAPCCRVLCRLVSYAALLRVLSCVVLLCCRVFRVVLLVLCVVCYLVLCSLALCCAALRYPIILSCTYFFLAFHVCSCNLRCVVWCFVLLPFVELRVIALSTAHKFAIRFA